MALTAQEQAEMDSLQKDVGHLDQPQAPVQASGGLTPQEQAEMQQLQGEVGHIDQPPQEQHGMLHKAFDYGVRALDYPGGFVRSGLASVAGLAGGNTNVVKPDDLMAAAKGKAPGSAEYLTRLGVTPGPSLKDIPAVGQMLPDVNLRDAEGFGLDVATDPLSAIAKGAKALYPESKLAAGAAAALKSPSTVTEAAGKSMFKSGLKKVDERLAEKGAAPLSDLLLENGKAGTTKQLSKDTNALSKAAQDERGLLYDKANASGVTIDPGRELQSADETIAKMKTDPGLRPMAEKLEDLVNSYKDEGRVPISKASEWKSNLYNALPESAYDAHGKVKGPAAKVQKALASDFKNAIVDAGNHVEPGLGNKIDALNETMQTGITAKRPLAMQVRRAETPNLMTSVDGMLVGAGALATHNPIETAGLLAAKKLADASKTTYVRTKGGLGLVNAGKSGLLNDPVRRGLINGLVDKNE